MDKKIPFGREFFDEIIEEGFYYIDKTKVIEDLLKAEEKVIVYLRPRIFGKSLFLSTLENFFNIEKKEKNKNLFDGLYISKSEYFKYFGKYPVIKINFNFISDLEYKDSYASFKEIINELYGKKRYIINSLNDLEKEIYNRILFRTASENEYKLSIKNLSEWLERYHKEKVIILIDQYDVPIRYAYEKGYYGKMIDFLGEVLTEALNENTSLKMAVMVGIVDVLNDYTGLNNVVKNTTLSNKYNDIFGFTESETKDMLEYFGFILTKEFKEYYSGYNMNGVNIYSPWDIISYIHNKKHKNKELEPYWYNSLSMDLLKELFKKTNDENKYKILKLIEGESVDYYSLELKSFKDYNDYKDVNSIYYLLFVRGYLTLDKENNSKIKVVNEAIRGELKELLQKAIIHTDIMKIKTNELVENIINGDIIELEKIVNKILGDISYYYVFEENELSYYLIMLGIFLLINEKEYIMKFRRKLRYNDVIIESVNRKLAVIIEIKLVKSEKDIESKLNEEIKIEEKVYYKELRLDKIKDVKKYKVVFYKDKCTIK